MNHPSDHKFNILPGLAYLLVFFMQVLAWISTNDYPRLFLAFLWFIGAELFLGFIWKILVFAHDKYRIYHHRLRYKKFKQHIKNGLLNDFEEEAKEIIK